MTWAINDTQGRSEEKKEETAPPMQLVNDILSTSVLPKLQGGGGGRVVGTLDTPSFLMNIPSFDNQQRQDSFQMRNPMGGPPPSQRQAARRQGPLQPGPQQNRRPNGPGYPEQNGPPRNQQAMQRGPQPPMSRNNRGINGYPPQQDIQRWQDEPQGPAPLNPFVLFFLFKSMKEKGK